jgi:hypothetical protein
MQRLEGIRQELNIQLLQNLTAEWRKKLIIHVDIMTDKWLSSRLYSTNQNYIETKENFEEKLE